VSDHHARSPDMDVGVAIGWRRGLAFVPPREADKHWLGFIMMVYMRWVPVPQSSIWSHKLLGLFLNGTMTMLSCILALPADDTWIC
jgi:hypothetical protein